MSEDATARFKADKALEREISTSTNFSDLRETLLNAVERSSDLNMTRDPQTGRFQRRDPLTPAAQTVEPTGAEKTFTKTVTIGGQDFEFSAPTEVELERSVNDALSIADAARQQAPAAPAQRVHQNPPVEVASAVESALTARGFDVDRAAADQFSADWASATDAFLRSPAGADWPGGEKNREILGMKLAAMGLIDAEDKASAIANAWAAMKKDGMVFDTAPSQQQLEAETANLSPQEILEQWKQAHGSDPDAANAEFMRSHSSTGSSSSLFGR